MSIISLLKIILGTLPFIVLCLINAKTNLNKIKRGRQLLMPLIALIYCVAAVFTLDKINMLVENLFNYLKQYIPFFSKVNISSIMSYILNALLILGFIALKGILLLVLNGIWSSKKIMESTSGAFYCYEEDIDKWLLKKEYANFRGYYKGFYYASLTASSLVFILSKVYPSSVFFKAAFYPVFGVLVLGEVVFYLSGMTKTEFVEDILGEDEETYKVANYGILRDILRNLYGSRILYENIIDATDSVSETFDALEKMTRNDDRMQKTIGQYFKTLKKNGADININYVNSCVNLLQGKSTLFGNPFYNDLTDYIMLPLTKSLISYKKCLVIMGRDSETDDVITWLSNGIKDFTGTNSLWKTQILDSNITETDIGIIRFSDIYNLDVHKANREFLQDVGFVIIIEPSRILSSGQIGLNLIVNQCEDQNKNIVYCAVDRNCDGLVDALSHALKTSITEVTATNGSSINGSQMYWHADGEYMHHKIIPNVSRYLGVGTEINAVAMKYQIPRTEWVGSEKFPVIDMKWIAGQYYKQICDYADMPATQDAFNRTFGVESGLWGCKQHDNAFLVVEDEFQNLFEMARVFASRAKNQGFINVISENYMLRDYMLDNVGIFSGDPKAIPAIVPDYARTERNTVLKLIMMMCSEPISEERIKKELILCGAIFDDPYAKFQELVLKHCRVEDPTLTVKFKEEYSEDSFNSTIIKNYEINDTNELYLYANILKNAYYIAEDEENEKHYIGSKLYGHVFQSFLPGQFMIFDGKYYEIQTITSQNGVIIRRAADHITGRHYYRQIRHINLSNWTESSEMGKKKNISGLEMTYGFATLKIDTAGYYDMSSYGNIKSAKTVSINNIPQRCYKNKSVLRVKLPESDPKVLYTICLVMNEIFRTTYPNAYQYISAVFCNSESSDEEMSGYLYSLNGECERDCIYIIEDSEIDLGLIVSVERYLKRYFEMITDILNWHTEKMLEQPEDEENEEEYVPEFAPAPPKKSLWGKIKDFFKKIFKGKKKSEEEPEHPDSENLPEEVETVEDDYDEKSDENGFDDNDADAVEANDNSKEQADGQNSSDDENKIPVMKSRSSNILHDFEDMDISGEDEETLNGGDNQSKDETEYQKNCFFKFGFDDINSSLDIPATIEYLTEYEFDNNPLEQARKCGISEEEYEHIKDPQKYGVHLCDFCGTELIGGEYELLKDGRERCNRCSMTAVRTADDFKDLFKSVLRNMEVFYGIKINTAVKVRMTDAKKIAKHVGETFVATPGFDGRVLGFAQKDKTGYSLYIENGSPRLAATATIAHELTHIWQYLNWNEAELTKLYGKNNTLEVYEGMAKWSEIQYLILLNEVSYAKRQEITTRLRDDVYGHGFIKYATKYPLSYDTKVKKTPFKNNPPL